MDTVLIGNTNRILLERTDNNVITRYNKDIEPVAGVASPLGTIEDINSYFSINYRDNLKQSHINSLYSDDSESFQKWTYVADYSYHSYYPHADKAGKRVFIHARINKDNELEFCTFDSVVNNNDVGTFKFQRILNQKINKDYCSSLRIAGKDEAEAFMLTADKKIKLSCFPKYAGSLQNETFTNKTPGNYALITFGHIWTYWYTIVDDTLYFIGLPLYTENTPGKCLDQEGNIVDYDIPPNLYYLGNTLEESQIQDETFYNAISLVKADYISQDCPIDRLLAVHGDNTEPTKIYSRIIARVDNNIPYNFIKCDKVNECNSHSSLKGGVYRVGNETKIFNEDTLNFTFENGYDPKILEGYSGFISSEGYYVTSAGDATETSSGTLRYSEVYYINPIKVEKIGNSYSIEICGAIPGQIKTNGGGGGGGGGYNWIVIPPPPVNPGPPCPAGMLYWKHDCWIVFVYVGHNLSPITFS